MTKQLNLIMHIFGLLVGVFEQTTLFSILMSSYKTPQTNSTVEGPHRNQLDTDMGKKRVSLLAWRLILQLSHHKCLTFAKLKKVSNL